MLFAAFRIYKEIKEGVANPKDFAVEKAMDALKSFLILVSILALPVIIFLGVLGFSNWVVDASGIARFFFWFFSIIYAIWFLISRAMYKRIKRIAEKAAQKIIG
ncbi:MAG: hypothetical protein MUD00_01795 [Candidatus Pacebacteria bacterium]|nr:hypothetical protein [Candidatus Paceibacterota bacterium]